MSEPKYAQQQLCNHKWRLQCYGGFSFTQECVKCKATRQMFASREMRALTRLDRSHIHDVYHSFQKLVDKADEHKIRWDDTIEKWASKYPNDVQIIGCDDSHFSSSSLVLIQHKDATFFMGTTVVFVPQCDPQPICEFFLYPGHVLGFLRALGVVQKEDKRYKPIERAHAKARAKTLEQAMAKCRPWTDRDEKVQKARTDKHLKKLKELREAKARVVKAKAKAKKDHANTSLALAKTVEIADLLHLSDEDRCALSDLIEKATDMKQAIGCKTDGDPTPWPEQYTP